MMAVGYIAQHDGDALVLANTVSKEYDIPTEYLLKILQQLVRANVLRSKRGPRGGFSMARPTNEISMLEIIEAISGPLSGHLDFAEQAKGAPFSLKMEEVCRQASAKCIETLANTKLSQMIK
jgi:Rrf2 family protein